MQTLWWDKPQLIHKMSSVGRVRLTVGLMPEVGENIGTAQEAVNETIGPIVADFLEQSLMTLSEQEIKETCDTPVRYRPDVVYGDQILLYQTIISNDLFQRLEKIAQKIDKPLLTVVADLVSHGV